jgi:ribosome-associated protein
MDARVNDAILIPAAELSWSYARSGGPGGQHVNKTETKVELRWTPAGSRALAGLSEDARAWLVGRLASRLTAGGELMVTSSLTRDQIRNREDAIDKLVAIIRAALIRPKKRVKTKPSRGAKERRLGEKKRRSEVKRGRGRGDDH